MTNNEKLRAIKAIDYNKYYNVSSLEKLAAYTIKYLNDNEIDTSWTNIVIAAYYLFPEKFAISEDFIDFPNAERLNRTLMHLVPPKGRNYAIGSAKKDYILTPLGEEVAKEVESVIHNDVESIAKKEVISKAKNTPMTYYEELVNSKEYKCYLDNPNIELDLDILWAIYKVIPYTQNERIEKSLKNARVHADNNKDFLCIEFIDSILKKLKK